MAEVNSLLAAAPFSSRAVILTCYAASQEQRQPPPRSLHEGEARSRAQHASCKPQLENTGKLNAQSRGRQQGQCRASVDVCLGEREPHREGWDFTPASSRSSSSNGAEAAAKEPQKVAGLPVCV